MNRINVCYREGQQIEELRVCAVRMNANFRPEALQEVARKAGTGPYREAVWVERSGDFAGNGYPYRITTAAETKMEPIMGALSRIEQQVLEAQRQERLLAMVERVGETDAAG